MPRKKFRLQFGQILALVAGTALIALVIFGYLAYQTYTQISVQARRPFGQKTSPSPVPTLNPYADRFNEGSPYSIVLMGYGGGTHQGGLLTDSMLLAYIDPIKETVTLISLPRDLWVGLEERAGEITHSKINAAYAIGSDDAKYRQKPVQFTGPAGGGEMAKAAVTQATGLPVTKFVALNFAGFQKTIDILGGVEVNVTTAFDDPLYPIEGKETDPCGKSDEELKAYATMSATLQEEGFPCRYELLHFDKGKQLMTGETALKYVRSRHSAQDGTDFGRANRQRNLLLAVKDKVFRLDFFPKIIPFVQSLGGNARTDITLTDMQNMLAFKEALGKYKITSVALSEDNVLTIGRSADGQSIVMPREGIDQWGAVHAWVQQQLVPPVASSSAVVQ